MATFKSLNLTDLEAGKVISSLLISERVWVRRDKFTKTGGAAAQNDIVELVWLPAGKNVILLPLSFVSMPAVTNGQCDVGHGGYTQPDGTVVATNRSAFQADKTITSASIFSLGAALTFEYNAVQPFALSVRFDGSGGFQDAGVFETFVVGMRG